MATVRRRANVLSRTRCHDARRAAKSQKRKKTLQAVTHDAAASSRRRPGRGRPLPLHLRRRRSGVVSWRSWACWDCFRRPALASPVGCCSRIFMSVFKRRRRFARFRNLFPDAIDVIVRGIKSGVPPADCLKIVAAEAPEPVRGEFKDGLSRTMRSACRWATPSSGCPIGFPVSETRFFAIVIAVQRPYPAATCLKHLQTCSTVLRQTARKMVAKIAAMSAEAKASGGHHRFASDRRRRRPSTSPLRIISGCCFSTTTGNLVLAACGVWMGLGMLVIRQMINFDF